MVSVLALAGLPLVASPALAASFLCELQDHTGNNTIPELVFVDIDPKTEMAVVFDPFIRYYLKEPLKVPYKTVGDNRYEISWRIDNVPVSSGSKRALIAVLRFDEGSMRATINTYLAGSDNDDRGSGPCKRSTPKKK